MTWQNEWKGTLSAETLAFIKAQSGDFEFCRRKTGSTATDVKMGGINFPFDANGIASASVSERALFDTSYTVGGDGLDSVEFQVS
jgi:hypothetical protein